MSEDNEERTAKKALFAHRSIEFCEIKDEFSEEFTEAMRIYLDSFPENERRPVASLEREISSEKSRLVIGKIDGKVAFMSLLHPVKGTSFLLCDYMAIAEGYRNLGIGERFLKNVFSILADIEFSYFLGEVENPYLDKDELKMRRVRFFKRMGMKELKDVRYLLPPLQETHPTEMILMVLCKTEANCLKGEELREILIRIFRNVYGREEDDEILAEILAGVPDKIVLV
jgi:GNAT superfamily N-acetyltransferase